MRSVLDEILATKRDEVTVLRRPDTRDLLRRTALEAPPTRGFAAALCADPATVEPGRTIGPPWRQDEKFASLAAWLALVA